MVLNRLLLTVALLPLTAFSAYAQSPEDELNDDIIVTGLRAVPVADITSSVSVINLDELNIRNSPFVVEQLRAVPGVAVSRGGSLSGLTQIRIRGAEANHTLVLLNGVEVSDPNNGETDFGLWSGLNVQRIEVARGEQSALYGSDAIGGVISITTGGEGFNASGEYGSFDTFRGQAGYQRQVEGLSYGISGSGFTTDGVDTSGVEDGERDGSTSYSFRENFSGDIFSNETIGQRTKASYSPSVNFGDKTQSVTLSGLVEIENEDYERIDTNVAFGDPNQNVSFDSFALGGEIRGRFNGFAVNGSLRHDDNDSQFENTTTWRVGAAYNLSFGGKIRGSIGEGVKNPTFTELFGFAPANFVGNPNLRAEKSQSFEVGYDQIFGPFNASITYFNADLEDEIFTNFGVFPFTADNREGDSEREGFEVSAGWQVNEDLSVAGSFSQIDSTNDSGVDEIRVPEWTGSASVNWESPTKEGFRIGIAADFVGEQLDTDFSVFDPVTFQSPDVPLDAYILLSATAEYPVTKNFSLTLRGENLFDETITE